MRNATIYIYIKMLLYMYHTLCIFERALRQLAIVKNLRIVENLT